MHESGQHVNDLIDHTKHGFLTTVKSTYEKRGYVYSTDDKKSWKSTDDVSRKDLNKSLLNDTYSIYHIHKSPYWKKK